MVNQRVNRVQGNQERGYYRTCQGQGMAYRHSDVPVGIRQVACRCLQALLGVTIVTGYLLPLNVGGRLELTKVGSMESTLN